MNAWVTGSTGRTATVGASHSPVASPTRPLVTIRRDDTSVGAAGTDGHEGDGGRH